MRSRCADAVPCRKGMTGCHRSCRHRLFVNEYRVAREAGEQVRDEAVGAYGPGSVEWEEFEPKPIVFKRWLEEMSGWGDDG